VRAASKMTPQAVGAYGEKMVEAALLRLGWIPSNVNDSVKNAARFDIVAQGPEGQLVPIRVKTCGPGLEAFQYGYKLDLPIPTDDLRPVDFTVLVAMGEGVTDERFFTDDRFFAVPTHKMREALEAIRVAFLKRTRKDGQPLAPNVPISLHLRSLRNRIDDDRHGFARKWECYLNAWGSLAGNSN
jgi:hypothetical protein